MPGIILPALPKQLAVKKQVSHSYVPNNHVHLITGIYGMHTYIFDS